MALCRIDFIEVIFVAKPIDEAAVWQRVSAASREAGPEAPAPQPLAPELLELLKETQRRAAAYQKLYRRTGKTAYQELFRQERRGAAKLKGLYDLMTETAPKRTEATPFQGRGRQLLRQLLRSEETAAGRLEALAEKAGGAVRETLLELCRQAGQHWSVLLELLGEGA